MLAYAKTYNLLREQILSQKFAPGQQLPPERQLCTAFGVSRITIRHAIRLLTEQGLVEKFQGRGTYVRPAKVKKLPIINSDFVGSIQKEAPKLKRILLSNKIITPPSHITEILGLLKNEKCLLVERLDVLNKEPIAFDCGYMPAKFADYLDEEILVRVDFWDELMARQALQVSHAVENIEAIQADATMIERLKVTDKLPVLLVTDTSYNAQGQTLGVFESYYRGDRVKLTATSTRRKI